MKEKNMKEKNMITTDYWNEEIDFDKEFIIYQWLCNSLPKRKKKKLKDEFKFGSYATWKTHIMEHCKKYEYVQLIELSRYLNLEIRNSVRFNSIMALIFIPFLITIISSVVFQQLNKNMPYVDIAKILNHLPFSTLIDKMFYIIITMLLLLLLGLIVFVVPMIFVLIIFYIAKVNSILELKKIFYEDYKEIIDNMIKERGTKICYLKCEKCELK